MVAAPTQMGVTQQVLALEQAQKDVDDALRKMGAILAPELSTLRTKVGVIADRVRTTTDATPAASAQASQSDHAGTLAKVDRQITQRLRDINQATRVARAMKEGVETKTFAHKTLQAKVASRRRKKRQLKLLSSHLSAAAEDLPSQGSVDEEFVRGLPESKRTRTMRQQREEAQVMRMQFAGLTGPGGPLTQMPTLPSKAASTSPNPAADGPDAVEAGASGAPTVSPVAPAVSPWAAAAEGLEAPVLVPACCAKAESVLQKFKLKRPNAQLRVKLSNKPRAFGLPSTANKVAQLLDGTLLLTSFDIPGKDLPVMKQFLDDCGIPHTLA